MSVGAMAADAACVKKYHWIDDFGKEWYAIAPDRFSRHPLIELYKRGIDTVCLIGMVRPF